MDVPPNNAEVVLEKIEDKKDGVLTFHCSLADTEIVYKIAQEFIPGLASACVDNTTGDIFRTPGLVAVNIRNEMVQYLTKRSETFVAESVILEDPDQPEVSDHPFDIISDFVDDFALSKRNLFGRVSGWMLSEKREDKIDDFVQEMEISGFWLMDRREAFAQVLLKNVDFKNEFHCDMKFNSEEELNEHMLHCGFNHMICPNEGCNVIFSASHLENHDSVCPFKIIPCEQKCPETLMRRDMDRHCITVCGMKLANCPFYAVGCQFPIPQCMMQQHHQDHLHSHLLYILQKLYRDKSLKILKKRIEQLKMSSFDKLVKAPDVRSLSLAIKDLEAKLEPFEEDTVNEYSEGRKINEVKIDGEGKVNKEVNITEEGKVNETGKVNEIEKISNEGKSNEKRKSNDQGKVSGGAVKEGRSKKEEEVNEEGKNNGRIVNEEGIIHDEENVNKDGKIDGGKVDEIGKINDEKRVNGGGEANEAGKISGGAVKEGKSNEGGGNSGREVNEEGIILDEGNVKKEGKINDEKRVNEDGKANGAGEVSERGEVEDGIIHNEGKISDLKRVNEERKANEAGKVNKEEKVSEEGREVDEEGQANEAGKVNKEVRVNEGERVSEERKFKGKTTGVKVDEEGKITAEVKANEERMTNEVGSVIKEEKMAEN